MRFAAILIWAVTIGSELAAELPAGTEIQVRLQSAAGSSKSKAGDAVRATVIVPVLAGGNILIPAGSTITGKVKDAQPAKSAAERATLELEFGELLRPADKQATQLQAKIAAVDNARETVDGSGRIVGIAASETLSAQMDKGLSKLEQRAAGLAGFLEAAKEAVLKQADVEIDYEPGVEVTLQLASSVKLDAAQHAPANAPQPIADAAGLAELVNREPFQTMAEKPPRPSDITNLMFIGSREEIAAAFAAAGWATAEALNAKSGMETFRAIAEARGYQQAPVSTLLLEGRKPDLVFQKQNNTFAQRHHMRVWMRRDQFHGQAVWVAAATHDIGIEFSPENRTFIHKIDSQIDRERAKVVNDLLVTGTVRGLALVERPGVPRESQNATGDKLETDGSMAVLQF